jgi:hypothetical protein
MVRLVLAFGELHIADDTWGGVLAGDVQHFDINCGRSASAPQALAELLLKLWEA